MIPKPIRAVPLSFGMHAHDRRHRCRRRRRRLQTDQSARAAAHPTGPTKQDGPHQEGGQEGGEAGGGGGSGGSRRRGPQHQLRCRPACHSGGAAHAHHLQARPQPARAWLAAAHSGARCLLPQPAAAKPWVRMRSASRAAHLAAAPAARRPRARLRRASGPAWAWMRRSTWPDSSAGLTSRSPATRGTTWSLR